MRGISLICIAACWACAALSAGELDRANELFYDGKFAEAAESYGRILESEPESAEARYRMVLSLVAQEKTEEAAETLAAAPEQESPPALQYLAQAHVAMAQDDTAKAAQAVERAAAMSPDEPQLAFTRGKLDVYRKRYAEAARDLDKAIELEKRNAYAHYYAGIAYSNLKRPDKMVNHFQYFLKLAPQSAEARKVQSLLRTVR